MRKGFFNHVELAGGFAADVFQRDMQIVDHGVEIVGAVIPNSHKSILAFIALAQHSEAPNVLVALYNVFDVFHWRLMLLMYLR